MTMSAVRKETLSEFTENDWGRFPSTRMETVRLLGKLEVHKKRDGENLDFGSFAK